MSNRLDKQKEAESQPKRIEYAVAAISGLGYEIHYRDATRISFMFNGKQVTLYPYSGWHTGKSIKDGRGLHKLLAQITPAKQ